MRTPIFHQRTLAAGNRVTISAIGRFVTIVSVSASTIRMGIDDETPEQVTAGMQVSVSDRFRRLHLVNAGAVASTVVVYVSDERIDFLQHTALAAILVAVATPTARAGGQSGAIGQTGVGSTEIRPANAARRKLLVQADDGNNGNVWIGATNAVTQAASSFELLPGATLVIEDTIAVWACSANGTETVRYHETT
jgi:hypothetical protein